MELVVWGVFFFLLFFLTMIISYCAKGLYLRSQPTRSLFEWIVSDKRKVGGGGSG